MYDNYTIIISLIFGFNMPLYFGHNQNYYLKGPSFNTNLISR